MMPVVKQENSTLFPVNENIGRGTGIGTLIPTYPHSIWFSYILAFDPF